MTPDDIDDALAGHLLDFHIDDALNLANRDHNLTQHVNDALTLAHQ